jgi:MFS family permease
MTEGEVGALLGPVLGIVGAASLFGGGYCTDRLARRDVRWRIWIPAIGALAGLPLLAGSLYVDDRSATLTLFGLAYFAVMIQNAPITALIQELVPPRLRARATAVFLLMTTLTGFGIGPTVAGFLSEAYRPTLGADSLRYALMTLTPLLLISAFLLALAAPRLARSAALRFDRIEQLGVVERLQEHLARSGLRRRLQQRRLASGGDHDRREIGSAGTQGPQQFDSTDTRQPDVRDQAIDLAKPAGAEQGLGRGAQQNLVTGVLEQAFECLEHTRVVFHEGNEKRGQPHVS